MSRIEYELDGWSPPADCRGCRFTVERAIIDVWCPVHGTIGDPMVGPPDWPPMRTARYVDGERVTSPGRARTLGT